jgi:hypothetical protein
MSRKQNNLQYGTFTGIKGTNDLVREEPAFLRRMREGKEAEVAKKEERRRRRASEEVIDEDEAPQVIIEDEDKGKINEVEAKKYVAEKAGVNVDSAKNGDSKDPPLPKKKEENVSLGMKKAKKGKEGVKRHVDEEEDKSEKESGKSQKSTSQKGKRMKLSFEEDE